jgi:hypothetical protein
MSDELTRQARPIAGISRRTALRGAAWSASAVTVVVAAPAHATTSPGARPEGSASGSAHRLDRLVFFDVSITNTGSTALDSPFVRISASPGGVSDSINDGISGWRRSGMTYTRRGTVEPGQRVSFSPSVSLTGNDGTARTVVMSLFASTGELLDTLVFAFTREVQSITGA